MQGTVLKVLTVKEHFQKEKLNSSVKYLWDNKANGFIIKIDKYILQHLR